MNIKKSLFLRGKPALSLSMPSKTMWNKVQAIKQVSQPTTIFVLHHRSLFLSRSRDFFLQFIKIRGLWSAAEKNAAATRSSQTVRLLSSFSKYFFIPSLLLLSFITLLCVFRFYIWFHFHSKVVAVHAPSDGKGQHRHFSSPLLFNFIFFAWPSDENRRNA